MRAKASPIIHQLLGARPVSRGGMRTAMSSNPNRMDGLEAPSVRAGRVPDGAPVWLKRDVAARENEVKGVRKALRGGSGFLQARADWDRRLRAAQVRPLPSSCRKDHRAV